LVAHQHHEMRRSMQIRVLGHLEASVDDRPIALGGAKQRAVLAMLGLEANRTVTADRLIDGLWGDEPPASAAKMVQNYVWRLRRALAVDGGAEIVTQGRGYELRIDPDLVDVRRLERLVSEAGRAAEAGEPDSAAREALALFRGDPLADLADEPFAAAEIRRLEELRETAAELAIEADLAAGRHQEIIGEIDALLAENPLRERLYAQRILALYRCGRQAEALEAYRNARRTLVEQIGVEPGPELRRLHEAILRQDASLDVEQVVAELPRELDATALPPLIGRDGELRRLQVRWQRTANGAGALVTLVGGYGMGKTRLAAALAGDAHREDAAVLYASGTAAPETALSAIAQVRDARRPTLLVLDDADRAPSEVHAAVRELAPALATVPALVLATGQGAAALARLQPRDSVTLGPLDAEAVRLIASLYVPAARGDAVPVETLVAASRGVARRVHEAAGEWARREATRRVDATAGRVAAGRSHTRALETELTGNVIELRSAHDRVRQISAAGEGHEGAVVCPYKGLATFNIDDAEYFFGREQLVAELVARLVGVPLLGVVGPSGSGKSSVVRAGLLHALAGGVLPGSDDWARALIRPGEHPMRELRATVGPLGGDRRIVLVVDQFEELFTACQDEQERSEFVAALIRAAREHDDASAVVLAVRADFYGRCAAYPELARRLGANNVLVGPMSRDELRRAIERPAERVGLHVEPELVDALLSDVEGQPGALPLLSTALLELWRQRDGRRLRLAAYTRSGGVHGAVARLAEDAFVQLGPSAQAVARNVLLRLAGEGEDRAIVRRRIELSQLEIERRPDVAAVVAQLTDRRLLTISDGTVEVAHEALLREWPRLRSWLDDDAQGRRLHRQIGDAAQTWHADARDPGGLYRGARLSGALEWRTTHGEQMNATERAFLDASQSAADRAQRRLRLVLGAVSLLLLAAVIAGLVALDQRGNARSEARIAEAQRLGAQALSERALDRSLLLARQAVAIDDSPATRSNLLAALLRSPAAIRVLRGDGGRMLAVAVAPDGKTVVAGDNQGRVVAYDTTGWRRRGSYGTGWPVRTLQFSPDGTRLAIASGYESLGVLDLVDAASFHGIARHELGPGPQPFHALAFSPDSRVLMTGYARLNDEGIGQRGVLARWDARTGRPLGRSRPVTGAGAEFLVAFAGREIVTMSEAERETVVRDARTLGPIRRLPRWGLPWASAVSPDGRLAALARQDGSLRLVDLRTGISRTPSARHDGPIQSAAFSADGSTLVTGGDDARVIVWDVARAQPRATFEGHAGRINGAALSPDGRTAYTASLDGTVIAWDLAGSRRLARAFAAAPGRDVNLIESRLLVSDTAAFGPTPASYNISASPNGDMITVGLGGGGVNLIDSRTLRPVGRIPTTDDVLGSDAFTADGRTMAIADRTGELSFWDVRTRERLGRTLKLTDAPLWTPQYSADGRWLAVTGLDRVIRLFDTRRRAQVKAVKKDQLPRDMAMRPDGKVLAVPETEGPGQGSVEILSVPSLRRVAEIPMSYGRWSRFSRDGRLLIIGDHEGRAQLYDGHTFKPRGRPLLGHAGFILTADFSPDGKMVATSSSDGTIRLWETASSRPIGAPLPGIPNVQVGAAFTRGGTHIAAVYDSGQGFSWDVRPSSWAQQACAVSGRRLSEAEWNEALPGRSYEPACAPAPR
jgi:DNA-binding SARP family transcriptional activator/WD40 repeat protein